jgi:hypothetical protein
MRQRKLADIGGRLVHFPAKIASLFNVHGKDRSVKVYLIVAAVLAALAAPASAQLTTQQQRMKDCSTKASGMTGDTRKQFMTRCLSGGSAEAKGPHCNKGKPCGNSCIAIDEVCHK